MIKIEAETIIQLVCNHYKVNREKLLSVTRLRKYCVPRQVCVYLIRTNTGLYLHEIAEAMRGSKKSPPDHSTMIHSCKVVRYLIDSDCEMFFTISSLQSDIEEIKKNADQVRRVRIEQRRRRFIEEEAERLAVASTIKHPKISKFIRDDYLSEQEKTVAKYLG